MSAWHRALPSRFDLVKHFRGAGEVAEVPISAPSDVKRKVYHIFRAGALRLGVCALGVVGSFRESPQLNKDAREIIEHHRRNAFLVSFGNVDGNRAPIEPLGFEWLAEHFDCQSPIVQQCGSFIRVVAPERGELFEGRCKGVRRFAMPPRQAIGLGNVHRHRQVEQWGSLR